MAFTSNVKAAGEPGLPTVFAIDAKTLQSNKVKIQNKDASLMAAYKQLLKEADKLLLFGPVSVMEKVNMPPSGDKHDYMSLAPYFWPNPATADGLPYIRKDGETNPEVKNYKDKDYMPKICEAVYTLGLAYYYSDNNGYAQHASKLLKVWFLDTATRMNPNLNYSQAIKGQNDGRGAGLIDARHFIKMIDGLGLIKTSHSWTGEDDQQMKKWFADYLNWMQTSKNGKDEMNAQNNHGAWYDAQRMSIALYTGDNELAKKIVLNAEQRLDKQMDDKGSLPKEMERTISLHYTTFAFEAFFNIAKMGEAVGLDMWSYTSPSGKSLKKGFDAVKPYYAGDKKWEGTQIKDFPFEEAYPLLLEAYKRYDCKDCLLVVKNIAGEKLPRLRLNLISNVKF